MRTSCEAVWAKNDERIMCKVLPDVESVAYISAKRDIVGQYVWEYSSLNRFSIHTERLLQSFWYIYRVFAHIMCLVLYKAVFILTCLTWAVCTEMGYYCVTGGICWFRSA